MDFENFVHVAHVNTYRALGRSTPVSLERRTTAVGRNWYEVLPRDVDNLDDVIRRGRVHDNGW